MCCREVEHGALLSEQKVSSPRNKHSMAKALSPAMLQVRLLKLSVSMIMNRICFMPGSRWISCYVMYIFNTHIYGSQAVWNWHVAMAWLQNY